MKIRNGFVSNSSSSSFVLIGERIKLSDINPTKIKHPEQYMFQSSFEGGEAIVYGYIPDKEMLDFLKKHPDVVRKVYEVFSLQGEGEGEELSSIKIPKGRKAKIFSGIMEQHSIQDLNEIREYYPEMFEDEEEDKANRHVMLENTSGNHNKFYEMTEHNNGTFEVRYGRIGESGVVAVYDINEWDKKYKEKINKGYELI
jgi:hypothetical protein